VKSRFISTAERELQEAIEFYEAAENGLGARFLDEVEAVVARIAFPDRVVVSVRHIEVARAVDRTALRACLKPS
jgi:hypothetical protein